MHSEHEQLISSSQAFTFARPSRLVSLSVVFLLSVSVLFTALFLPFPSLEFISHSHSKHKSLCTSSSYKATTLKPLLDVPLSLLIPPPPGKLEASGVLIQASLSKALIVFDNLHSIAQISLNNTNLPSATWIHWPEEDEKYEDSGFEFVTFSNRTGEYVLGREAIEWGGTDDEMYVAETVHVEFEEGENGAVLKVNHTCLSEFSFEKGNKGFEGGIILDVDGEEMLLGLCEGNFCRGGKKGRESGNGRMVLMRKKMNETGGCVWETVQVVKLPKEVDFEDYSGMAISDDGAVAIVSQQNAAMWVGEMRIVNGEVEFLEEGRVYDFLRGNGCEVVYCNVEGVGWMDKGRLLLVSDSMKGGGKQSFLCREKDESMHVFALPG